MAKGKVEEILSLFDVGDKELKLGSTRDVILVLGEAGADKSSLTHFIIGDDQNLVSRGLRFGNDWVFKVEEGFTRSVETTYVPKLVVDIAQDGAAFYDCPEFSEKPEAEDIASGYFIQKVINRAESAKLVLVVRYDSVKQGSSFEGIEKFLANVSTFIKNIDKFKNSIGVVITQVDVSGSEASVREFLSSAHQHLLNKKKVVEANLLSVLLVPEKIGIWKRPSGPGLVREIQSLQDGRQALKKLIYEGLQYVACSSEDFGIVLSGDSKRYLRGIAEEMNSKIVDDIAKIGDQFIDFYRQLEKGSRDIDALTQRFRQDSYDDEFIGLKYGSWNGVKGPKDFVKRCLKILDKMRINISKETLISLLESDKRLAFAENAMGQPLRRQVDWAGGFQKFVRYLDQSSLWYQILGNLQNVELSSYRYQQNIENYREAGEELKAAISNGKYFLEAYERFLRAVIEHQEIVEIALGLDVDDRKKELLREVVDVTLENDLTKTCAYGKLTISGQFVKVSDVKNCDVINLGHRWSEEEINCCQNPNQVELFATHKVFFDADIDWTGKEIQLSIIAPTWEVVGDRKILLDGKPGGAPSVSKAGAQNDRAGSPGNPGVPGIPGGPAGGLVAIGQQCVSCSQLEISLVGGKGGAGQDGGDGVKGEDGAKPYDPRTDPNGSYGSMKQLWKEHGHDFICDNARRRRRSTRFFVMPQKPIIDNCNVLGLDGKAGGRGGDGGKGGVGGPAGEVTMVFIRTAPPNVTAQNGPQGDDGLGGVGGEGGKKGDNLWIRIQYHGFYNPADSAYRPNSIKALSGVVGAKGQNTDGLKLPRVLNFINPSFTLNNYKAFMRTRLNRSLLISHRFLDQLGSDERVTNVYDTLGLVKDMQSLEEQFNDLQNQVPLLSYYQNIQKRIDEYSNKLEKTKENDDDHKIVLSYLYSSVLTKIRNINNKLNEGLVVNIIGYLQSVKANIAKLKQAHEAVNKNKSKQVFQQDIKNKVEEAKNFIAEVIGPEIKNTIAQTNEQIDSIIDEVLALEASATKERDQLIIKQHKLQDQIVLRYLLGVVDVGSKLLGLAGPVGATVGTVVGGVSQVAQGLLLTDDDGNHDLKAIPEGVKKSFTAVSDHFKKKKESFKQQLTDAQESLEKLDKEAQENISIKAVKNKIQETESKLKIEMEKQSEFDPESIDRMYNMRKELEESLDKEKELLEKASGKTDKKVDYIGKVKELIEIGKAGKEIYDKIMKSQGAIDKLGDSIKKANDNIAKLEQQEQNVYKTIMPMVKTISDTLQKLHKEGSSKSHVALDVSKWQIQSSIQDISKKLKEMTQGYKAQGELIHLMGKVEHGMVTMVQVYDRIQDYQEKAELADYLTQISLTSNNAGNIKDPILKDAVDYLAMNLHFNIVLSEYEKSINSLKHSVFPFAKRYLNSPQNVTSRYHFEKALSLIDNVVNSMMKEFDSFIEELKNNGNMVYDNNQFVSRNHPYVSALGSFPFYSWEFTGNEDVVEKLLDGREIILTADVTDNQVENLDYAIKFNQIGIELQLSDPVSNKKMKSVLEGFKVNMTHLGHSYYVCGSKSFTILHNSETIQHPVNKGPNGHIDQTDLYPGSVNEVYEKLRENEPLLSPYTTWKINLFKDSSKRGDYSLEKLAEFRGQPMTLELEGRGQNIQRSSQADDRVCNDELDKFYQEVKTSTKEDNTEVLQDVNLWELLDDDDSTTKNLRISAFGSSDVPDSEPSFLSGVLGSISEATKYLNPAQWFTSQVPQNQVISDVSDVQRPHKFTFHDQQYLNTVDTGLLNLQSNLLLIGLLGSKTNQAKVKRSVKVANDANAYFAHDIAYRAYAPKK